MTSDRPYRLAPGQSFAIRELGRHAGTQFDPSVVEALTRVLARAGDPAGAAVRARAAA
jgi:HD-GYP domain-containing protein (c-di-GMP phosphodiesterase class II)